MNEEPRERETLDRLTRVLQIVEEANQKFGADLKVIGSWKRGYSEHDIDVITECGGKRAVDAAKYIAEKTGFVVDMFLAWVHPSRLDRNVWVFPDGRWGYGIDFTVEVIEHALHKGQQAETIKERRLLGETP